MRNVTITLSSSRVTPNQIDSSDLKGHVLKLLYTDEKIEKLQHFNAYRIIAPLL